jgi:hypothetical protein
VAELYRTYNVFVTASSSSCYARGVAGHWPGVVIAKTEN